MRQPTVDDVFGHPEPSFPTPPRPPEPAPEPAESQEAVDDPIPSEPDAPPLVDLDALEQRVGKLTRRPRTTSPVSRSR